MGEHRRKAALQLQRTDPDAVRTTLVAIGYAEHGALAGLFEAFAGPGGAVDGRACALDAVQAAMSDRVPIDHLTPADVAAARLGAARVAEANAIFLGRRWLATCQHGLDAVATLLLAAGAWKAGPGQEAQPGPLEALDLELQQVLMKCGRLFDDLEQAARAPCAPEEIS
jgi:hypothetical protein